MSPYITQYPSGLNDIGKDVKFIALINESFAYQGSWYGPPDPPAGTETFHYIDIITFNSEQEVISWLEKDGKDKKYVILPYNKVSVTQTLTTKMYYEKS